MQPEEERPSPDAPRTGLEPVGKLWKSWAPLWRRRNDWNGYFFPVGTVFSLSLLLSPYLLTNMIAPSWAIAHWDPKTLFTLENGTYLDHTIPFVDWSILIYYTIFAFYVVLPFSAPKTDVGRSELLVAVQFIAISSWLAYLIFLFLPAEVDLRNQAQAAQANPNWTDPLYGWFYWLDRPYNAWPSLHVTQTFLAAIAISRWWKARGLHLRIVVMWILWVALTISTLTTKQHFLWDALSGLVLGLLTWWFGFRLAMRTQNIFGNRNASVQT